MSGCYIACRSLTSAQHAARLLDQVGFSVVIRRLPANLRENGCGYAVMVSRAEYRDCVCYLKESGIPVKRAFWIREDGKHAMLPV